mgnify:FL=1
MTNEIVKALECMCNKGNQQDKKLLLLAKLVEAKHSELGQMQDSLQKCLDTTNEKLDKLTVLIERYERDTHGCPVYKNRDHYEKISFYVKNPKISLLIFIGILAILGGFFGTSIVSLANKLITLL